ncbi:MAG TPA: hypothetical protein VFB71_13055, partial [Ramlibacter sp.]|nr:hypothetical protein [Ramlibacter sp.]
MVKKLKLRVPRAEDAPAELREFYAPLPNGTGFILQYEEDPDGYGIDQIGPLRAKVAALTEDVARQINRVQQFKKADGSLYTPEELTTLASGFTELQGQLATLKDKTKTDEQKLQQLVADAKRPLLEKQQQLEARNKRMTERAQKAAMQQARDRALDELKPLPKFRGVIGAEIMRHLQSVENEETGE